MRLRILASLWLVAVGPHFAPAQTPTAPDASAPPMPAPPVPVVGAYDVGPAGDITRRLRAVVYRPAALPASAPVVILLHGNHGTCGRPYNPAAAPAPPQATITVRNPAGAMVAVFPIEMIDTPGLATGVPQRLPFALPPGFTQTYTVIAANTLDPPGLPCTRPVAGGACMEGIRIDDWFYDPRAAAPGTCTAGTTEVLSHTGYEYLGLLLASQGYVVISVDANLVNNAGSVAADFGLIQARGTLVINHLHQLDEWNRLGGAPASAMIPMGRLDLGHVALVGHSRGGEGVRAAYNMAAGAGIAGLNIDGVFEIAPTDFQGQNSSGVTWNVLLPMCDGDVSNLAGVRAFDRMMQDFVEATQRQKSNYTVWGANHNFYNTQSMVSDTFRLQPTAALPALPTEAQALAARFQFQQTFPCTGGAGHVPLFANGGPGSAIQRMTALSSVPALARGNAGNAAVPVDAAFNQNFNPLFRLPTGIFGDNAACTGNGAPFGCCTGAGTGTCVRVDRGYSPTAACAVNRVIEDFNQAAGTNTSGQANTAMNVTVRHLNGQGVSLALPAAPPAACTFGLASPATPAGSRPPIPQAPVCNINSLCTAAGMPQACCTGAGAGTCTNQFCTAAGRPFRAVRGPVQVPARQTSQRAFLITTERNAPAIFNGPPRARAPSSNPTGRCRGHRGGTSRRFPVSISASRAISIRQIMQPQGRISQSSLSAPTASSLAPGNSPITPRSPMICAGRWEGDSARPESPHPDLPHPAGAFRQYRGGRATGERRAFHLRPNRARSDLHGEHPVCEHPGSRRGGVPGPGGSRLARGPAGSTRSCHRGSECLRGRSASVRLVPAGPGWRSGMDDRRFQRGEVRESGCRSHPDHHRQQRSHATAGANHQLPPRFRHKRLSVRADRHTVRRSSPQLFGPGPICTEASSETWNCVPLTP